jgi:acyl-CoA dehydrogenase
VTQLQSTPDLIATARRIGTDVAGPDAAGVDRDARFPRAAIAALREERMLGAMVPAELGGQGATIGETAAVCETLGRYCASTAMIYAMHQIEIACLVRHALHVPYFSRYLSEVADRQLLIGSATSEIGVGGDLRRSVCAVERDGDRFQLR